MKHLSSTPRITKLKLFCRFNGEFLPKPPHNKLRYVGGETKVITVEKSPTLSKLVRKICQLCPNLKSFSVKYKLVLSNSDSEWDPPLVSIECEDDVKCLVEEFDERVKLCGNKFRIWLFVENKSCFFGRNHNNNNNDVKCGFDLGIIDDLECCGRDRKESGKLSKDERFGRFNKRDVNFLKERNGYVDCNGLITCHVGSVRNYKNEAQHFGKENHLQCGAASLHVSKCGLNEKDYLLEEGIQLDPPSSLILDHDVETKESVKRSKVIGGTSNDLSAFYNHLAANELQAIKYSDLEFVKELGSGTYGTVYHGRWKGSEIAIKKLKPSCFTGGSVEEDRLVGDFWKEAHILGQLHHPNIVAFYGVVTDEPANNLATVTEYMVNGSLREVLKRKDRTIDSRKRLIIAMDAAFGMEYLHEKNIVHFDLKSHNLLVNMKDPQRPICKIGDLGLSKIKKRTLVSGGVRGTIPWMAPELLNSKNMVTEKVDVYSFGVVMWELLTGEVPYANLRSEEIIAGIIKGTLRPEIPSWINPTWRSLMVRCWSSNPDERPAFTEIAKELRTMAAAMNIK